MKYQLNRQVYDYTTPAGQYDTLDRLVNAAAHIAALHNKPVTFTVDELDDAQEAADVIGEWLPVNDRKTSYQRRCSLCGGVAYNVNGQGLGGFCTHCGHVMKKPDKEESA